MSKAKVMVVEDESIVAIDISQRLESLGYQVTATVSTGEKAVEMAEKTRPDIILMDIVLKGDMDGIEAAEEITRRMKVPIIYITAYSDEETLKRAKITGPFGYIIKPFEDRELHSVIEVALHKHQLERRLAENDELFRAILSSIRDILFTADSDERLTMISPGPLAEYGLDADEVQGKKVSEVFGDRIHSEMIERALNGETVSYEWVWEPMDNSHFETTLSPLRDFEGNIKGVVGVHRDVTEKELARRALERETAINKSLAEISKKLLSPMSLEEISASIIERAKKLTGSRYCMAGFFESDGSLRNYFPSEEVGEECHVDAESTEMGGLWNLVLRKREPVLVNDPPSHPESTGVPEGHIEIRNFLACPALLNDELVGILAVSGKDGDYDERDLEVMERLADIYAIAIHRKIEEDRVRASEERNRALVQKFLKIVTEVLEEIK
ncbi:GAF domain-containing protein [Methanothermobacter sp.]|uniref:GAF domain-containing protein n=1 Tax=Methanothermobacter sp. TaxID=1884223 RepID=UPI002638A31D|nr:GAF domain-containing protein [Methanothermobacter sp.]MDI9615357.1 GAF domain-containing protein [Methanothermobacter sp.]